MRALFTARCPVVLASASPRRQLFLEELGIAYTVVRPQGVEPRPLQGENPAAYACRAAVAKARAVAEALSEEGAADLAGGLILAADTVVALGDTLLGKPRDEDDALHMLRQLAGRSHQVISAVSCVLPGVGERAEEVSFYDSTEVLFHPWPESVLAAYARCGEPMDKAGAYAIQGQGAFLVSGIRGSWSTVVGLPVTQLTALLLDRGVICSAGGMYYPYK